MSRYSGQHAGSRKSTVAALAAVSIAVGIVAMAGGASAAPTKINLGTADSFAVLAGAGTTNTGPTTVTGDMGTFPTTSMVGQPLITLHGVNHAGDAVTQGAKTSLVTAYNNAAGQGPQSAIAADLGGLTLVSGVYNSESSILLTGDLILDGQNDPNAVFVFQAGSSLTTMSGSRVRLINGAQSCNVYWQVGSSATIGTTSTFVGNILALTSITLTTNATVDGRVLARNGAVTMDTNTITRSVCSAASPSPTSSQSISPTPSQVATPPAGGVGTGW
jgi:type VI secretion system secreted protein VgrG